MTKRIALIPFPLLLVAACVSSGSTVAPIDEPASAPTEAPARGPIAEPTLSQDQRGAIAEACADADSELIDQCIELMGYAVEMYPGELAAICIYIDGTIEVVAPLDREGDAENECLRAGITAVDRIVATVTLPETPGKPQLITPPPPYD